MKGFKSCESSFIPETIIAAVPVPNKDNKITNSFLFIFLKM